jgi:hypothetical protein
LKNGIPPTTIYKALYERYSRLQFTRAADRAVGIAALEARLLRAFDTSGGYGIFEKFLGRSLLWRPAAGEALERIDFRGSLRRPPSWSWMAYTGGIDYFDVGSDHVDWADIRVSFPSSKLRAKAQAFNMRTAGYIYYDVVGNAHKEDQECVIVATGKGTLKAFYLLIIAPDEDDPGLATRLGVAFVEGDEWMIRDKPARYIVII